MKYIGARWGSPIFTGLVTGLVAGLTLGACSDDDDTDNPEPAVTYWQDVAPIYYENCATCHRDNGIAPFRLDTYEDAKTWAQAAAAAVDARTMPPWLVTDDGSCGEFHDSRALSTEEIDTIKRWAEQGAAAGEPRALQLPSEPGLTDGIAVVTPDYVPEAAGTPDAMFDDYRCFLVESPMDRNSFVTAYEVVPGNEAIVHHVILATVNADAPSEVEGKTNGELMQELDDQSPDRLGWPCYSGAGEGVVQSGLPAVWAPGQGVVEYPAGTGTPVSPSDVMVVQMHYNLANPDTQGQSDSTMVRLRFEDQVERPGIMVLPDLFLDSLSEPNPASLPPGQASVLYTWELPAEAFFEYFGTDQLDIYGVMPHMHERGVKIRFEIESDAGKQCMADVQNWDFNWQLQYFYKQAVTLPAGSKVRVTCDFNTEGLTEPVLPGWGTGNEMCLMGMFIVPRASSPTPAATSSVTPSM